MELGIVYNSFVELGFSLRKLPNLLIEQQNKCVYNIYRSSPSWWWSPQFFSMWWLRSRSKDLVNHVTYPPPYPPSYPPTHPNWGSPPQIKNPTAKEFCSLIIFLYYTPQRNSGILKRFFYFQILNQISCEILRRKKLSDRANQIGWGILQFVWRGGGWDQLGKVRGNGAENGAWSTTKYLVPGQLKISAVALCNEHCDWSSTRQKIIELHISLVKRRQLWRHTWL